MKLAGKVYWRLHTQDTTEGNWDLPSLGEPWGRIRNAEIYCPDPPPSRTPTPRLCTCLQSFATFSSKLHNWEEGGEVGREGRRRDDRKVEIKVQKAPPLSLSPSLSQDPLRINQPQNFLPGKEICESDLAKLLWVWVCVAVSLCLRIGGSDALFSFNNILNSVQCALCTVQSFASWEMSSVRFLSPMKMGTKELERKYYYY